MKLSMRSSRIGFGKTPPPTGLGSRLRGDFGIRQGEKTRVIDDCTVCGLNLTVGTKEKFSLHTIDQLCGMLDHSFKCSKGQHCKVLGRTYDLKSAYKQFGLCSHDRDFVRIAVNKPGAKDPVLLGLNALPFGAIWIGSWIFACLLCNLVDRSFWNGRCMECLFR